MMSQRGREVWNNLTQQQHNNNTEPSGHRFLPLKPKYTDRTDALLPRTYFTGWLTAFQVEKGRDARTVCALNPVSVRLAASTRPAESNFQVRRTEPLASPLRQPERSSAQRRL